MPCIKDIDQITDIIDDIMQYDVVKINYEEYAYMYLRDDLDSNIDEDYSSLNDFFRSEGTCYIDVPVLLQLLLMNKKHGTIVTGFSNCGLEAIDILCLVAGYPQRVLNRTSSHSYMKEVGKRTLYIDSYEYGHVAKEDYDQHDRIAELECEVFTK